MEDVTGVRISNTLAGTGSIEVPLVPEVVLVPNAESDFTFTNSTGTITAYTGTRKDVVIPSTINGVPVKVIGPYLFNGKGLISVTLPNSVTTLGNYSFFNNQLTSVRIPDSVTSIGASSFTFNKLTSVTLSNSLTSIGEYAFSNNLLTSVTIPSLVTRIEGSAFGSNPLTSALVPTSTPLFINSFPSSTVITRY